MTSLAKKPSLGLVNAWDRLSGLPGGSSVFSFFVGRSARYTGTIGARVLEFGDGMAQVEMRDRPKVRNHLHSVHAIALMNLGELCTGLAVMSLVDGRGRGIVSQLSMEYTKKARGTITGRCDAEVPESPGVHDVTATGTLRDAAGDVVAVATAQWRIEIFEQ